MSLTEGLYPKYIVTKADGTPVESPVFVLKPETDGAARKALIAYAFGINRQNPELARDLMNWVTQLANDHPLPGEVLPGGELP